MAGELGKNTTIIGFIDILEKVMQEHKWPMQGHGIKYVRPHFDTRTGDFFGITFETVKGPREFFVVNENRNRDLTEWVMEFLNTPPG